MIILEKLITKRVSQWKWFNSIHLYISLNKRDNNNLRTPSLASTRLCDGRKKYGLFDRILAAVCVPTIAKGSNCSLNMHSGCGCRGRVFHIQRLSVMYEFWVSRHIKQGVIVREVIPRSLSIVPPPSPLCPLILPWRDKFAQLTKPCTTTTERTYREC